MSKLTEEERFSKVMKFLVASTVKKIARLLAMRGFSEADRHEGWSLLDRAGGRYLVVRPEAEPDEPEPEPDAEASEAGSLAAQYQPILSALDAWQKLWFDVADAALGRSFPSVRDRIFLNLTRTSGSDGSLCVKTLLTRLEALGAEGSEESGQALALLEKRGLTRARMDEAAALLGRLTTVDPTTGPQSLDEDDDEAANRKAREAGVKAMWAWYQEWTTLARTAVKNRNYLVMLGLTAHRGGNSGAK